MSYLGDFLFPPQRAQAPVRALSGGERNRLLLARLFARPANLLVLDEPTNDLDIESLELLEATLQEYAGTLLLVSHDRAFLDNVVTQTLVAEGGGKWREYVGGYSDWLAQRPAARPRRLRRRRPQRGEPPARAPAAEGEADVQGTARARVAAREIEALEREQHALTARMCERRLPPAAAPSGSRPTASAPKRSSACSRRRFERWSALEEKAKLAAPADDLVAQRREESPQAPRHARVPGPDQAGDPGRDATAQR